MAAFDVAARGLSIVSGATLASGSFTNSGTDRAIFAWCVCGDAARRQPTTVKWNTTESFQLIGAIDVGSFRNLSLWRILNPTVATATVVADWGTAVSERMMVLQAITGVNQITSHNQNSQATGTGLTLSSTPNTVSGNLVIDGVYYLESGGPTNQTLTAGAGQTSRQKIDGADFDGAQGMGTSTETAVGSTTVMSWTLNAGATDSWGSIAINVNDPYAVPLFYYKA